MAAQNRLQQMKVHAGYAPGCGVTRDELREVIDMTPIHAELPRALNAATALPEVFGERDRQAPIKTSKHQPSKKINMNNTSQIWFVTGASKGLGLALVQKLLQSGHKVAATSRKLSALSDAVSAETDDFLPLEVDLLNEKRVGDAIEQTTQKWGRLDVVVNNAGYGQLGTLEELSDAEARTNFDVNVFALLNVTRAAMPQLRAQKSGHFFNIASIGGYNGGFAGWGVYCATKFAVAGLSESLAAEAALFNVGVTIVYPGYFRTEFLDSGSLNLPENPIAAYTNARESEAYHEETKGNQPGDPHKAAQVMIEVAAQEKAPLHLFLGADAYQMAHQKIEQVQADLSALETAATATDIE